MRNFQGQLYLILEFILFFGVIISLRGDGGADAISSNYNIKSLNRTSFPTGFVFGAASSAYQVEGATNIDGKGPSIWDTFTQKYPQKIEDQSNGSVATDSYHLYKEDVKLMKNMRLDAYRFSISWSRVIPQGKVSRGVNEQGLHYYRNLINELLKNGIEPFVTLFHWDTPQALEDEYGGFLSPQIVNDYRDYANLCFQMFGKQVKNWITFNEPSMYIVNGYVTGDFAPGRCSFSLDPQCTGGDSGVEPYIVAHNQLRAHAAAVKLYKHTYQDSQKGQIGITLESTWMVPYSDKPVDQNATSRSLDFHLGWFMAPLTTGNYPETMRSLVGSRLPKFSEEETNNLKNSFDFIGLNYYTANYVQDYNDDDDYDIDRVITYTTDSHTVLTTDKHGVPIGSKGASNWLYVYPRGIHDLLVYVTTNYNNPAIYITENGFDEASDSTLPLQEALNDYNRVDYHFQHLSFVQAAISEGVNVKGYFAWSIIDNFEWNEGYTIRFGLHFVDFRDGLKRYKKLSARWFKKFLIHN